MTSVRLRSSLPGRGRWRIDDLRKHPERSSELEIVLRRFGEVRDVSASAVTGSVLVLFDPALPSSRIEALIRRVTGAAELGSAAELDSAAAPVGRAEALLRAGSLLALASLLAGPFLLVPAVLGAAALATVSSVLWQSSEPRAALATRAPVLRIYGYARRHRRTIVLASALSLAKKLFELVPPLLIALALDRIVSPRPILLAVPGLAGGSSSFLLLGAVTLAAFAAEAIAEFGSRLLWRDLGQAIQHELRLDVFDHVQRLELSRLEDERMGTAALTVHTNVQQLEHFMNDDMHVLVEVAANTAAVVLLFGLLVPGIGWIALAPMPILAWAILRYQRSIGPLYAEIEQQSAVLTRHMASTVAGVAAIRSYTAETHVHERVAEASERVFASSLRANRYFALFDPAARLPFLVGFTVVLAAGGMRVLAGTLSVGLYALMLFLIQRLVVPFGYLSQTVNRYQKSMKAIDRVFALLELEREPLGGDRRLLARDVRGAIAFESVVLEYEAGSPVLRGFTLQIAPGERLGIVGSTGAGKSSLVKLLLRFHEASAGRVLLDDVDLREYAVHDLRRAIALVPQEAILFDGSIRSNIAYGDLGASGAQIEAAARAAEADEFIARLPEGYDSVIGAPGVRLSGGERQRISLARAILKNAPILVLDEATSAVDLDTEAAIQRSLGRISADRTVLVIAHRLSSVRAADRIVVLDGGVIVEQGSHDQLCAQGGLYARLWRVQTGESSVD